MENSLSTKFSKFAARIRKSSSQLFPASHDQRLCTSSTSPSLNKCLSENNIFTHKEGTPDKQQLLGPCDQYSDTSSPSSTPRRSRRRKTSGKLNRHFYTTRRESSPSGIKKSSSLMEHIFKKYTKTWNAFSIIYSDIY